MSIISYLVLLFLFVFHSINLYPVPIAQLKYPAYNTFCGVLSFPQRTQNTLLSLNHRIHSALLKCRKEKEDPWDIPRRDIL